jgi:probable non-F420 flavinoid oxidoreductase
MIGFHCSHEQHSPASLLWLASRAADAGFEAAMCSDHFHPWSEQQAQSGFTWSWLGAALQATRLSFGTVCAPGQRYHPAIIAQAAATLAEMFPDRFWVALGSGEALNEAITGDPWPPKAARNARLKECVEVMRRLWAGETVTHDGLVRVREAKLYSLPPAPPMVVGAAISPETAAFMAPWVDALITVVGARDQMRRVIDAFRADGGEGKPMFLQVPLAFGRTDEESADIAFDQWRHAALTPTELADLPTPRAFDAATRGTRVEEVTRKLRVSADVEQHLAWLQEDLEMGFSRLYLHNIAHDHTRFFDAFGTRVLPAL